MASERHKVETATTLNTLVDALVYPVRIELSAGQVSDHIFAPKLIKDLLSADGGYDSISLHSYFVKIIIQYALVGQWSCILQVKIMDKG